MAAILTVTLNPALDISFEIERMVPESKLRGSGLVQHPGGGGINVARAATTLGGDVEAVWLGGGCESNTFAALLDAEGVRHHQIATRGDLRTSIHVEERATTDMYRFVLPGPTISASEADAILADVRATTAQLVVMSGSMPPSLPEDFYAQLAAAAPRDARVILDTSGEPLARGLAGGVFVAKPNRNELGRMLGKQLAEVDDVIAAARELIAAGRVEALAVSMAAEGLVLVTADSAEHVRAPKVEMVSAVGAGDSTVAGLAIGLARGWSLRDAARLAIAAGTAAVLTPGSELLRREDTERLHAQLRSS
jgi:6-phosphofructokinase 2